MPQYRPPVQHAHTGHTTHYDYFDNHEHGNVLVAMIVDAGTGTSAEAHPSMVGAYYEFMEQCRLENGIVDCDCTAYSPTSPSVDPSSALSHANVPVHVASRRTEELHPSEWELDFYAEEGFNGLFQDGSHPTPMPSHIGAPTNLAPRCTVTVGAAAKWRALAFVMVTIITSAMGAFLVNNFPMTCKSYLRIVKQDNKPVVALPVSCACVLGLICAMTLFALFVRHTFHILVDGELAFVAGTA